MINLSAAGVKCKVTAASAIYLPQENHKMLVYFIVGP